MSCRDSSPNDARSASRRQYMIPEKNTSFQKSQKLIIVNFLVVYSEKRVGIFCRDGSNLTAERCGLPSCDLDLNENEVPRSWNAAVSRGLRFSDINWIKRTLVGVNPKRTHWKKRLVKLTTKLSRGGHWRHQKCSFGAAIGNLVITLAAFFSVYMHGQCAVLLEHLS